MNAEHDPATAPAAGASSEQAANGKASAHSASRTPRSAIEAVEAHFQAVVAKDEDRIIGAYAPTEDLVVFVEGPRWSTHGHAAVATGWRAFCAAAMSVRAIDWVEGPAAGALGDGGAFVAGVVDLDVERTDGSRRTVRLRGTHVLARTAGGWTIAHEHFSQPAADPYGIGDWL